MIFLFHVKHLCWNLYRIWFSYKLTKNIKIPFDQIQFVAQRAIYYRKLDELRAADSLVFYHDESWLNIGEEKQSIWMDSEERGRIRKTEGKDMILFEPHNQK